MSNAIDFYNSNAKELSAIYESLTFEEVHGPSIKFLPSGCEALDIGAGSGRDAAWLKANGYKVTAIEPSSEMRHIARNLHPEEIDWLSDSLPNLDSQNNKENFYGLVLVSGVWMHIAPSERKESFSRISKLIRTNGILLITLRHGPLDERREMFDVSKNELVKFAGENQLILRSATPTTDHLNRGKVSWESLVLQKT